MSDENLSAADNQSPSLVKSSALVGSLTMVSRVLGLLRDIVIASVFGAGSSSDAFFVAFKVPNFLRRLFAEGAFSQAFVPVLADYKNQGSVAAVRQLLDRVAGASCSSSSRYSSYRASAWRACWAVRCFS